MWWDVHLHIGYGYNVTRVIIGHKALEEKQRTPGWVGLDKYIVERAMAGCGDCAAAILECSEDMSLMHWLERLS